jgi:hypothetical protein
MRIARQFARSQTEGAAPPHLDCHVLLSVHAIRDRRRQHAGLRLPGPEPLAGIGPIGDELAHPGSLEYEASGRRQYAAIPRVTKLDTPGFLARDRIPGCEMAFQTTLDLRLDLRVLGQAAGIKINAGVPREFMLLVGSAREKRK